MFEDRTYEKIMAEALADAPPGVDVRQGSIYYDAIAGACFKIASYYADLRTVFDLVFLTTAVGEYLDEKGAEVGLYRNYATPARYEFNYQGMRPKVGERFFNNDGKYFRLAKDDSTFFLEAETVGESSNDVIPGTSAVPQYTVMGLTSATFGELIEPGTDIEDDEDYRQRIREKLAGPAENGNRQHYKTWCEEDPGVARARIIPLFAGANTVMGVIIGADGAPAVTAVVERVQEYIDPITLGRTVEYNGQTIPVGDGLGNGKANIGAHFVAVAAEAVALTVSFTAVFSSGATKEQATTEAAEAIREYLKDLALNTPENELMVVRVSAVGNLLYSLPSIIDYADLMFNGASGNIELSKTQVAILEEVVIVETVR